MDGDAERVKRSAIPATCDQFWFRGGCGQDALGAFAGDEGWKVADQALVADPTGAFGFLEGNLLAATADEVLQPSVEDPPSSGTKARLETREACHCGLCPLSDIPFLPCCFVF